MEEAFCFAHHFLSPRPVIRTVQQYGVPMTIEVLGSLTGCYERCLKGIRKIPGTHVPAELNRKVKDLFHESLVDFVELEMLTNEDNLPVVDFGTFMDGYEE